MKKAIIILLLLAMSLSLMACKNSASQTEQPSTEEVSAANPEINDAETENDNADNAKSTEAPETEQEETETEEPEGQENKVLVVYFSATHTTEGVAQKIASGLNADIYEITPEEPYTDEDLNYHDDNSRTTIETNDPDARPAISGSVENMEQYEILFIGYPIWWGEAPRIMNTFVESYDFSGKTIVPFCTSGSSGIGSSATNLEKLTSGAQWLSGQRLNGGDSQEKIMEWVNSLGLDF